MSFLFEAMNEKKNKIEEYIKLTKSYYKSILVEKNFELSLSTNSSIKILNRPSSIDVYSKDINYFSNPLLLMCYQLLFQISQVVENAISLDITEVLNLIRNTILKKLNTGFGLGKFYLRNIKYSIKILDFFKWKINKKKAIILNPLLLWLALTKIT